MSASVTRPISVESMNAIEEALRDARVLNAALDWTFRCAMGDHNTDVMSPDACAGFAEIHRQIGAGLKTIESHIDAVTLEGPKR